MSPSTTRTNVLPSPSTHESDIEYRIPRVSDGHRLLEIARNSEVLDVNSSYAYLLWCHDFADTSIVATARGAVVGFITGYQRPNDPATLMVWQVAVEHDWRGRAIAATMLHHLIDRVAERGVTTVHTTISPENTASQRLFRSVAAARSLSLRRRDLFSSSDFDDSHDAEELYLLEPLHRTEKTT